MSARGEQVDVYRFYMKKNHLLLSGIVSAALLSSCGTAGHLSINSVGYQSVRTDFAFPEKIPVDAKIATVYSFDKNGELTVIVKNLTQDIMTIDNKKSFLIMPDGNSISYFDPVVTANTKSSFSSETNSSSFNLGALSSALGIVGPLGSLMGGLTIGSSHTEGQSNSSTVILADQPTVSIGPNGAGVMPKHYSVPGVGVGAMKKPDISASAAKPSESRCRFSVCVSYSFDNGKSYDKLITNFYVNTTMTVKVDRSTVDDGFKRIYAAKADALSEPCYMFHVATNLPKGTDTYRYGILVDYK